MNASVLVVAEQSAGEIHPLTWEALTAACSVAGARTVAAILGADIRGVAVELAGAEIEAVYAVESERLEPYTADGYAAALEEVIAQLQPGAVIFPHTYQTRDFVPKLAARFRRSVISDCIGVSLTQDGISCVRQVFQGKIQAEMVVCGDPPWFITVQRGHFPPTTPIPGKLARIEQLTIDLSNIGVRTRPEMPFLSDRRSVDLSKAQVIVAVGRGLRTQEQIAMARQLADAIDGELAASRPICDQQLLPSERQIGSSGQTVAPKVYLALGISGATQHVVGMRGAGTIIAVNKDPNAPIFQVADYGVVGDLNDILPALLMVFGATDASKGPTL